MTPSRRAFGWGLVNAGICLLLAGPVVAGLVGILLPAFGVAPVVSAAEPGLAVFAALVAEPGLWRSIAVSGGSALVSTALAVALTALILAAAHGSRALVVAERLLAPLLAVPHAAAALGIVFLFAPSGFILRLLSPWATGFDAPPDIALLQDRNGVALTLALALKETPFLFLMALSALGQTRAAARMAVARTCGHGRMLGFLVAVWPLIYRQLKLPVLAVLAFGASVVDMALILGPTRPPTLAVRILSWLQSADLSKWLVGAAASVVMVALVAVLILVWRLGERLAGRLCLALAARGPQPAGDGALRVAALSLAALLAATMFLSFAGLFGLSFAGFWRFPDVVPAVMSPAAWVGRAPMLFSVLSQTLGVALGTAMVALPLAVALLEAERRGRTVWWVIYAPLVAPQVSFLFGLNVLLIGAGVVPGVVAVTLTHALFALPYALIALSGPWRALDPRYEALAASLGRGPVARFTRVRLPLMVRPLFVTGALCVAVSVGLYVPTQMIGGGRVVTATTEAVAAGAGGDRRLIGIFATMQLAIPLLAFTLARVMPRLLLPRWRTV
ncbi:MAG: ABC transporter permease [Pseudomonadota bacterium]